MAMNGAGSPKTNVRDWSSMMAMASRLLQERTGKGRDFWNRRIAQQKLNDRVALKSWLKQQGVEGYAQTLLIYERFGYPDFLTASADELVDAQYRDRPALRPVFDATVGVATAIGEVTIQARKTYVSLVSARRTFARIQATTRSRIDLGLRLEKRKPGGRLTPSKIHETMPVQVSLSSAADLDSEVLQLLQAAYDENC